MIRGRASMHFVRVMHVKRVVSNGKVYWYHQKTGERLPDEPNARALRVFEINAKLEEEAMPRGDAGTLSAAIRGYRSHRSFLDRADKTRLDYGRYLDWLDAEYGGTLVKNINREAVNHIQDERSGKPRTADLTIAVLSVVLKHAIKYPSVYGLNENPAAGIEKLHEGEWPPWPEDLIEAALEKGNAAERKVIIAALYTAQRCDDLCRLSRFHIKKTGSRSTFIINQRKTGEQVHIPIYGPLQTLVLDEMAKDQTTVLLTKTGKPWTMNHMSHVISRLVRDCGFRGHSLHGLRKNAAERLAVNGLTVPEIQAIGGWRSPSMVQKYTKGVDKAKMAENAHAKLERGGN